LLVAILVIITSFVDLPMWALIGVPLAKTLASVLFYVSCLRKPYHRAVHRGADHLIGRSATTISPLRPTGYVKVDGELWSAHSVNGKTIAKNERVQIHTTRGNSLLVLQSKDDLPSKTYWNLGEPR